MKILIRREKKQKREGRRVGGERERDRNRAEEEKSESGSESQ